MPRGSRHEWAMGNRLSKVIDGPWTCDCVDYGLKPRPNSIGECATCRRPVYDENGKRITT